LVATDEGGLLKRRQRSAIAIAEAEAEAEAEGRDEAQESSGNIFRHRFISLRV